MPWRGWLGQAASTRPSLSTLPEGEKRSPGGKGLPLRGPLPAFQLQPAALATHITGAPPLTHGGLLPLLLLLSSPGGL